ncbi:hypothetical protein PV08_03597 [Exophiala spinifera]|uniref:DUF1740-domain-containing protein n=1 Tax=Exophiala spinifera TaxID=91928 RepID=A0A0D2BK56_9EURO|nr:uncharacterized protein PV08_03597 [Exophiala spinifera]KIW19303.1 hypothetical protein PV08_03597 [Exophiala spinifera]
MPSHHQEIRHQSTPISSNAKHNASSWFVEDRRGDRRNLEYASPDRYAIPRYYTSGGGALIGLSPNYRIVSKSDTRREVQDVGLDSGRKSRKQSLLSAIPESDDLLIRVPSSPSQNDDLQRDFLRFSDSRPKKRRRLSTDLDGSASSADSSDLSDGEDRQRGKSEHDAFDAFKNDPIHQRHMELSRATTERPEDVNAWLTFIKYQQVSFSARHEYRTHSAATSRSLADIRISLYEQALSNVKDPAGRHALILGLMQEGSKIWDVQKQASQWQPFLDKDSTFDLWILYLNFIQSNAVRFNLDSCLHVYRTCLAKFSSSEDGSFRDSQCIYLLLRLTLLLWQSGFTERAIGLWQAVLEFNLFRPCELATDTLLSEFEQFWSSEVPRIGEDGATGWYSNSHVEPEPKVDKEPPKVGAHDFTAWAHAEIYLEKYASLPARALDDVPDDDPYRILLFSDIQEFIFSTESKRGTELLQDAFLLFLGLPPCHLLREPQKWKEDPFIYTSSLAFSDPDMLTGKKHADTTVVATSLHDVFRTMKSIMASSDLDTIPSSSQRPVHLVPDFVRRGVSQIARVTSNRHAPNENMMEYAIALDAGIDPRSARKQAKSFLKKNPNSLRLYNVYALVENEAGTFGAAEKVWSTALSMQHGLPLPLESRRRDMLGLWRDWIFSYMRQRRFHHARILLSMMTDEPFDFGRFQAQVSNGSAPSAANQVKIERHLRLEYSAHRVSSPGRTLPIIADLLALQKYLNGGFRLGDALDAYRDLLRETETTTVSTTGVDLSMVTEKVHERRAQFVYAHSSIYAQPFRPKEARQVLADSTRLFPNNTTLLTLHHYFLQKSGLVDRLRQWDDTNANGLAVEPRGAGSAVAAPRGGEGGGGVISSSFGVLVELGRPSYAGSTDHSVRAAFKRATTTSSQEATTGPPWCVDTWKSYVTWESTKSADAGGGGGLGDGKDLESAKGVRQAHHRRHADQNDDDDDDGRALQRHHNQQHRRRLTALTDTFYAAIRACPWSKEMHMLAFTDPHLASALGTEGLKRLHESMTDRGLRLRTTVPGA